MTQEPKIFPYIARLLQGAEVVWKPLGEVLLSIKTGLNPRQFFTLNTENAKNYYITIRELKGGKIIPSDKTDKMNDEALKLCQKRSNLEVGDILFSGTGTIGEMAIIKEEPTNWNIKEGVYSLKPNHSIVRSGYICHILNSQEVKNKILNKSVGGTVRSIPMKELQQIQIPLPPLSIQQEIVRILDKFTELEAELEAELEGRKRQYEYYRNKLLTFNEIGGGTKVEWKTLGEVFEIIAGGDIPKDALSETETNEYNIPILSNGINEKAIYGWTNISKINKPSLTISARGTIGWASYREQPFFPIVRLLVLTPLVEMNLRYAYHFMKSIENDYKVPKVGIPQLTKPMIKDLKIPLPPLSEQQRIATILDKFDTLVNSISEGLPKEIALRRKQYEYYREQLLSFPKQ